MTCLSLTALPPWLPGCSAAPWEAITSLAAIAGEKLRPLGCALPVRWFRVYAHIMAEGVMAKHGAVQHWANIEVPSRAADPDNVQRSWRRAIP